MRSKIIVSSLLLTLSITGCGVNHSLASRVQTNTINGFVPISNPDPTTRKFLTMVSSAFDNEPYINEYQKVFTIESSHVIQMNVDGFVFKFVPANVEFGNIKDNINGTIWSYKVYLLSQPSPSTLSQASIQDLSTKFATNFSFIPTSGFVTGSENFRMLTNDNNTRNDWQQTGVLLFNPSKSYIGYSDGIDNIQGWVVNGTATSDPVSSIYPWLVSMIRLN